jgi:hypothetical protein
MKILPSYSCASKAKIIVCKFCGPAVVSHLLEKIECIFRFYFLKNDHNRTLIKGL